MSITKYDLVAIGFYNNFLWKIKVQSYWKLKGIMGSVHLDVHLKLRLLLVAIWKEKKIIYSELSLSMCINYFNLDFQWHG